MATESEQGKPQARPGPIAWLPRAHRTAIEQSVAETGRPGWRIRRESDLSEFACHPCAIVSDGAFRVFLKLSDAPDARRQFEVEVSALATLARVAGLLTPPVIDIAEAERGTLLLMEAVEPLERGPREWREIGAALARVHSVKGDYFGYERDGYWGPLHQDNTPTADWLTFYGERRLSPLIGIAAASGHLPHALARRAERLLELLPDLVGPEVTPALLHGDAQANNWISTAAGPYLVDPAIHYGHPEMDLAALGLWESVPDDVYEGYRAEMPIAPDFPERCDLWRVPTYLAGVALEGSDYLPQLTGALARYG